MISMSDIDEPICPRAPPSSARTTSRRSSIDRSSSCRVASCFTPSATSFAIRKPPEVCRQRVRPFPRPIKLTLLRRWPVGGLAGGDAVGPALGQELVQQDRAPAQREQRVEQSEALAKALIRPVNADGFGGELPLQRGAEAHPRMQQEIGGELDRIVPAKIVEIDKDKLAARPPHRIVKAKIRRAQRLRRGIGLRSKREAGGGI